MSREAPRPWRRLLALGLVQLAASAAGIGWLARGDEDAPRVAALHLGSVAALWLALAAGLVALARIDATRRCVPVFGLLPAALFAALFALYAVDAVALGNWGHTVTFSLLRDFAGNLPNLVALAPTRAAVSLGFVALAGWLFLRAAPRLRADLASFGTGASRRVAALGLAALLVGGWSAASLARAPALWSREPLASLLDLRLPRPDLPPPGAAPEGLADYRPARDFRRAHVVLIVVDALRADSMGVYDHARDTTPHLSRLRDEGKLARVELGVSTCSQSECGVLSLLGSQEAGRARPGALKLHDVLHVLGYRTRFLLSGAHLEWHGLADLFGPNVDLVRDDPTNDDANLLRALRDLPDADAARGEFLYLHLMSTHWFGVQRREHQRYQPTAKRFDWLFDIRRALAGGVDEALRGRVVNRYDNAVLQADAYLQRILDVLEAKGFLADAVVAIAADHGEALGERGDDHYGHGADLYQELIRVPILFLDTRGVADLDGTAFASQPDVAPTLLDRLGVAIPRSWDGVALGSGAPRRWSFHEAAIAGSRSRSGRDERTRAVVWRGEEGDTLKLIRFERRGGDAMRVVGRELYDLGSDPGETRDLAADAPEARTRLEARLAAHFGSAASSSIIETKTGVSSGSNWIPAKRESSASARSRGSAAR